MVIFKRFISLLLLTFGLIISIYAQNVQITGVVVDSDDIPIIGATVTIKDTPTIGTVTDLDGNFSISAQKGDILVVSYIGYNSQNVTVKNNTIKISLKENTQQLEEVVVTAYGGTQLRSKVTNSISKVNNEIFDNGSFSNIEKALTGSVSGLSVIQNSGNPTSPITMTLRGGTNFDGTGAPLCIVDGHVRDFNEINPEDIESINVLKDAGSTAIYGARANNGVILVTTKTGTKGKIKVNFKSRINIDYFKDQYDFLDARDYLYYMRKGVDYSSHIYQDSEGKWYGWSNMNDLVNALPYGTGNRYFDNNGYPLDGNKDASAVYSPMIYTDNLAFLLDRGWQLMKDPVYGDDIIFYDFSLKDVNIKSHAVSQDYNLSMSAGNDKGSYYMGIGYNDNQGLAIENFYRRFNYTLNADYQLTKWMKSSSKFKFSKADFKELPGSQTNESNYFGRLLSAPPTMRGYNDAGEYILGKDASDGNQLLTVYQRISDKGRLQFDMNQAFDFFIMDGLSAKISASLLYSEKLFEEFDRDYLTKPGLMETSRKSSSKFDRVINQTYTANLMYNKQLKHHYVDAMLGAEYYSRRNVGLSASGSGAPTDDFMDLQYTDKGDGKRNIDSWHNEERILSFFGRLNYDYKSKYLLSFVIRKDGYSKLIGDNRWGVFPGISTGWVFSKESFMNSFSDVISFGKLRASYGLNGNVSGIGIYDLQGSYSTINYDGSVGFKFGNIPNPYLVWEKSHTVELGLDLSFFENRVNTNFSFYNRRTKDKFADIPLPGSSGMNSIRTNNGELQNAGIEFDVNFRIIDSKDFKWNLSMNGSFIKNKIISLPNNGLPNNRQNGKEVYSGKQLPDGSYEKIWVGGYQEGQRPGDMYAHKWLGIYKSYEEIPGNLIDKQGGRTLYGPDAWAKLSDEEKKRGWPIQPGDSKWFDVNGDGVIDQYDQVKVGNSTPKFMGGISTSFSWKGIKLGLLMDYSLGHSVYDSQTQWIISGAQGTFNTLTLSKESWSQDNPNGYLPVYTRYDSQGKRNYDRRSSMFVYDASYLAFRELSLSYTLPENILKKSVVDNITFSVTGRNLGYITGVKYMYSPEKVNSGYPLPISLILGLNVSF